MGDHLKRCAICLLFCAITVSCSILNKNVHTETESAISAKYMGSAESALLAEFRQRRMQFLKDTLQFEQKIKIRLFDTDKLEPDGTHPMFAEIDVDTRGEQGITEIQKDTTSNEIKLNETAKTDIELSDNKNEKTDKDSASNFASNMWSLNVFLAILGVIFVLGVIYKKIKK